MEVLGEECIAQPGLVYPAEIAYARTSDATQLDTLTFFICRSSEHK